jgi:hypothetical protein
MNEDEIQAKNAIVSHTTQVKIPFAFQVSTNHYGTLAIRVGS